MKRRIVVAMSGGVDSSVAAALLVEAGYEVVGMTLHLLESPSRCCSLEDAEQARRVAEQLGIRFYVANYTDAFRSEVMEPFADAYLSGRTPIPCVACNRRLKFGRLLGRARALGAEGVATGHYARVERDAEGGPYRLLRGRDARKDQSYFLFGLDQESLAQLHFPVGEMDKAAVRTRARTLGLAVADKPESQEICFVPDGDYARVVERLRPAALPGEGDIVDSAGRRLGRHGGVHRFTVGQRRGLGVAGRERLYVKALDAARNRIAVAPAAELTSRRASLSEVSWVAGPPSGGELRAAVQIRYRHRPVGAHIEARGTRAEVTFDQPVTSVAPGQAAVFYRGDAVLGGGWIDAASP